MGNGYIKQALIVAPIETYRNDSILKQKQKGTWEIIKILIINHHKINKKWFLWLPKASRELKLVSAALHDLDLNVTIKVLAWSHTPWLA